MTKKTVANLRAKKAVPAGDVDSYLSSFPPALQTVLEKLRQAIKAAAPKAEEIISYQIPTYKYHGPLVHFVARQDYCSFIVASRAVLEKFKQELAGYKTSGTTIHFTAESPLPPALVKKIVKARIAENELAAKRGSTELNAKQFVQELKAHRSAEELKKIQRYFKSGEGQYGEGDEFMGVRMGQVFALAKEFMEMPVSEIEKLLESPIHEARVGAVSIMDWKARDKKTPEARRKELFDLYIKRHDRINNWDLVDRSAPYVVGGYLFDKPRALLYKLARSRNMWERRTAIVSTFYFIRKGEVADTFKIAETLLKDKEDLIHKAAGGWLREAGKKDRQRLLSFLDKYAATMPRTMLRYAVEHLDKKLREHYMSMK